MVLILTERIGKVDKAYSAWIRLLRVVHLIPHRSGNVNLYLKFGTPTPEVLNLIVYAEFQNHLEIDRNRRVVYDLSQGA